MRMKQGQICEAPMLLGDEPSLCSTVRASRRPPAR